MGFAARWRLPTIRRKVAIAGGFDPLHIGHLDHMQKAAKLGKLIVIVATDEQLIRKKGFVFMPLRERMAIISAIKGVSLVIPNVNSCADTLKTIKPNIFAKGGDRTPDNMPQEEIEVCKEIGCRIVYGIGDLLNSSSELVKRASNYLAM